VLAVAKIAAPSDDILILLTFPTYTPDIAILSCGYSSDLANPQPARLKKNISNDCILSGC
jgi:hypothetical protein